MHCEGDVDADDYCDDQFNGGPRVCIGQQLALTEAGYVLVRLLQRFDDFWADPEELKQRTTSDLKVTGAPGGKVEVKLHEAGAA